jgi:uncharacterized protein YeaO (DUF488 family)
LSHIGRVAPAGLCFEVVPVRTKRWNDPAEKDDGFRLLVCRIRPRGVSKAAETWDDWWPDLGPSRELLAAFKGKAGSPLPWQSYIPRYLDEMRGAAPLWRIRSLAGRVAAGETITLLCSSACTDPAHCHRTLLARLIERPKR